MLIKNALTAVNQGNLTGNYTVLRDLGAPSFRDRNSAAQLATIFQHLREQKTDLSPVLVLEPVFTEAPSINQAGELQLVGFFRTQPLQVQFRLAFQKVQGGWAIDMVSIGTGSPQQNLGVGSAPQQQQNLKISGAPQSLQNSGVSNASPEPSAAVNLAARLPNGYAR